MQNRDVFKKTATRLLNKFHVLDNMSEGISICNKEGIIVLTNQAFNDMFHYEKDELIGKHITVLNNNTSEENEQIFNRVAEILERQGKCSGEFTNIKKDGHPFSTYARISTLESGGERYWITFHEDIDEYKALERALKENREQYQSLLDNIDLGFTLVDQNFRILMINDAHGRMFNKDTSEFINKECFRELAKRERACPTCPGKTAMATGRAAVVEEEGKRDDGSKFFVRIKAFPIFDPDGKARKFIEVVEDITEKKIAEQSIEQLAYYDSLTGLANRKLLKDRLNQLIAHSRRHEQKLGVIFLDLDRFKVINDTMGHTIGDMLLKAVAKRLLKIVRASDTVARLGGDEFVIVIPEIVHENDISSVVNKIMKSFSDPFKLKGRKIFTTVSIGIAIFPHDGQNSSKLLRNADTAMYVAKDHGRNNYQFFSPRMNQIALERLLMENSLRSALEREELYLVFQPQVDLENDSITCVEALLRWNHPQLGIVLPNKFIPIAEEIGMITQIDKWVLLTACQQVRKWNEAGFPSLKVAVNLSCKHFKNQSIVSLVEDVLNTTSLNPSNLELELTESTLMENVDLVIKELHNLKKTGVSLALDDFGTGYSSLSYLRKFPLDRLKIDRSFINDITSNSNDLSITEAIISLAQILGLKVIAEGVETAEQVALLCEKRCLEMQGYHFCKPASPDDTYEYLFQRTNMHGN